MYAFGMRAPWRGAGRVIGRWRMRQNRNGLAQLCACGRQSCGKVHRVAVRNSLADAELGQHPDKTQSILAGSVDSPFALHAKWGRPAGDLHRFDVATDNGTKILVC
jgi:hypothetical protein